jgi:hypothetical protein
VLQPNKQLMKCGTLNHDVPQRDRKALSSIGFADFSFDFSVFCSATVSDSEAVFLCTVGSNSSGSAFYS